jgi:L,D-peptidoglycan transpeptidase YkuD (ErfK/YbiS/YcfS/YnhG family)
MNASSLENKTVRPGSLGIYSYYHSDRRPTASAPQPAYIAASHTKLLRGRLLMIVAIALISAVGIALLLTTPAATKKTGGSAAASASSSTVSTSKSGVVAPVKSAKSTPAVATSTNHCAGNTLTKLALVSINQRHMWVCQRSKTVYDSPVITGIDYLAADVTPTGTYHVYAKQTDTTLTGSDTTGSWSDPVSYWMPFLQNQYGSYGFHDATWRAASDFGTISPNSATASHGCVELPLATAKWLYSWMQVGTTVTIES